MYVIALTMFIPLMYVCVLCVPTNIILPGFGLRRFKFYSSGSRVQYRQSVCWDVHTIRSTSMEFIYYLQRFTHSLLNVCSMAIRVLKPNLVELLICVFANMFHTMASLTFLSNHRFGDDLNDLFTNRKAVEKACISLVSCVCIFLFIFIYYYYFFLLYFPCWWGNDSTLVLCNVVVIIVGGGGEVVVVDVLWIAASTWGGSWDWWS